MKGMVRGKGFEPLNLYGWDLKSHAFGQLDYPRAMAVKGIVRYNYSENIISGVCGLAHL